jgi:hypothetical protein
MKQFSLLTSTSLMKTSSGGMPRAFPSPSAIALSSAFCWSTVRPSIDVIWRHDGG